MSLRSEWVYPYTVDKILAAAKHKRDHHKSRHEWWSKKKDEVFCTIREGGLEISESLVSQYSKTGYGAAQAQVKVDPELQKKLDECIGKLNLHKSLIDSYSAYVEVFESRPSGECYNLHIDDYQFFFGF